MLLAIGDNKTIAELQEKFNECFPHLKIEFYHHRHHWKQPSLENDQIEASKKVGEVSTKHEHGILEIKSGYQAGRVEQDFHELFGLNAQIYRFEDGKWVQTTESDSLTLKEQQEIAPETITHQDTDINQTAMEDEESE